MTSQTVPKNQIVHHTDDIDGMASVHSLGGGRVFYSN